VIGAIGPQGAQGPTAASEPMPSDTPMLDSKEREPAEAIGPASVSRVELADDKERVVPSFAPSPVVLAPGSSASAMNSTPIVPGMTVAQSTPAAEVTGEHPSMASPGSRGSIAAAVSQITPVPPHPAHTGNLTLLRWRNALNTYPKTAWEPPPFLERLKNLFRSYRLLLASIPMVLGTGLLSVLCHYTFATSLPAVSFSHTPRGPIDAAFEIIESSGVQVLVIVILRILIIVFVLGSIGMGISELAGRGQRGQPMLSSVAMMVVFVTAFLSGVFLSQSYDQAVTWGGGLTILMVAATYLILILTGLYEK
jgi:hypothetical protein